MTRVLTSYSVAVQQMVAIARALKLSSKVLILDEPTSSLDDDEVRRLFDVLRRLREQGLAILFVTHFLNQVYAISDRITVLRNSRRVGEWRASELGTQALIAAMLGRELAAAQARQAPPEESDAGVADNAVLDAIRLGQKGQLQPLDLRVRAGEVVGIAGLLGSGRTELAKLLFGLEKPDEGELRIDGIPVVVRDARAGDPSRHRVLSRGAQGGWHRRGAVVAREHRARVAGAHGRATLPHARRTERARRTLRARARHQGRDARHADRPALRRQSAKGAHRAMARDRAAPPDSRRAHARHRCRARSRKSWTR